MPKLMKEINIISRCAHIYRCDKLSGSDLSSIHLTYILAICRNPGISQESLAKQIYINKSNVTRQLEYLENHGYVERKQSESDKRVTLVYPTEKAEKMLPVVIGILTNWNDYLTEGCTEEELRIFSSVLEKITNRAKNYVDTKVENTK